MNSHGLADVITVLCVSCIGRESTLSTGLGGIYFLYSHLIPEGRGREGGGGRACNYKTVAVSLFLLFSSIQRRHFFIEMYRTDHP